MGEDHQDTNNHDRVGDRVTIAEAATLLGVHPNTVRNRVKAGIYNAQKVVTDNRPTWMLDRDSALNNPLPKDSQRVPSQRQDNVEVQATQLVQDLLRPFVEDLGRVREELGAERVLREQAERERDELAARLEALTEKRDASETALEGMEKVEAPPEQQEPVERRSWLHRFFFGP